jgi:hypothetical protein
MASRHTIWTRDLEERGTPQQQSGVYFGIFSDLPARIAARLERPRAPFPFGSFVATSGGFPVLFNRESSHSMSSSAA